MANEFLDVTSVAKGTGGESPPKVMQAVGSFISMIPFEVSGTTASTTNDSISIDFPQLSSISGFVVTARRISDGDTVDVANMELTTSGTELRIKEDAGGLIELNIYSGFVFGPAKI